MESIRPLVQSDIPAVAQLFQKVFRKKSSPTPPSLISYFEEIYLNNPWRNEKINSLVYERENEIDGFLGAIPFPMILHDQPITAVIGGNYMINPSRPNPMAGVRILKNLFLGPQDLTYTDTATETARKIWEGLGSNTIQMYSMQWLRILRPSEFALFMGTRNSSFAFISAIAKPISYAIDSVLSVPSISPFKFSSSQLQQKELTIEQHFNAIKAFSSRFSLTPNYSELSFAWLMKKAEEKQEYGPLKKYALYDSKNTLQGLYSYYPNKGKLGHVLQIITHRQSAEAVLNHLFADAKKEGSLALSGQADPKYIQEYSSQNCIFNHRNFSTIIHTQNKEILNAFNNGNAFFSRLEGEWWTRLQGDKFV